MLPIPAAKALWDNKGKLITMVAILVVAVVVAVWIGFLYTKIHFQDKRIAELEKDLTDSRTEVTTKTARLNYLEGNNDAMVKAGKQQAENGAEWRKKYASRESQLQGVIESVLKFQAKDGESDCEATTRLLTDYRTSRLLDAPQ